MSVKKQPNFCLITLKANMSVKKQPNFCLITLKARSWRTTLGFFHLAGTN